MAKKLTKGSRILGDQRSALATDYAERYRSGESIRKIAEDSGRSYGFVHGVLTEAGLALRARGGATRGAAASATTTSGGGTSPRRSGASAGAAPAPDRPGRSEPSSPRARSGQGAAVPGRRRDAVL